MQWNGRILTTYQDLLIAVVRVQSKAEAQEFLRAYEAVNPHARHNIGWIVGDLSREEGRRVLEWFECPHPVFGTTYPTAQEAFEAGMNAGRDLKNSKKNLNPWFVGVLPQ